MAIWQLRGWVVPANSLDDKPQQVAFAIRGGAIDPWLGVARSWCEDRISLLGLVESKSWDSATRLWGEQDSHYLEQVQDGDRVQEVAMAIDARIADWACCKRVAQFLAELNAKLVTSDGTIAGSTSEVVEVLRSSDAWRFVLNPEAFLRELNTAS